MSRPRVDLDELRAHRAANIHPAPRGRQAGKLLAEGDGTANGHADFPLAVEYDRAYNAGKGLQQLLIDLAALLGDRLATMVDPPEIVTMLESEYLRILAALVASLRDDAEATTLPREE